MCLYFKTQGQPQRPVRALPPRDSDPAACAHRPCVQPRIRPCRVELATARVPHTPPGRSGRVQCGQPSVRAEGGPATSLKRGRRAGGLGCPGPSEGQSRSELWWAGPASQTAADHGHPLERASPHPHILQSLTRGVRRSRGPVLTGVGVAQSPSLRTDSGAHVSSQRRHRSRSTHLLCRQVPSCPVLPSQGPARQPASLCPPALGDCTFGPCSADLPGPPSPQATASRMLLSPETPCPRPASQGPRVQFSAP